MFDTGELNFFGDIIVHVYIIMHAHAFFNEDILTVKMIFYPHSSQYCLGSGTIFVFKKF